MERAPRARGGWRVETLVLGVRGVLVAEIDFQRAAIAAAARSLEPAGVDPRRFERAAHARLLTQGPTALVSRTLRDLDAHPGSARERRAVCAARRAVPELPASPQRAALRALCAGVRLACLDVGPPETLDTVVERFGLTARAERCVWTDGLGRDVRPPRPGAFRWLAARLDTRPNAIVYVAGSATTAQAAERAGWRCVRVGSDEGGDIERLLEILESTLFAS